MPATTTRKIMKHGTSGVVTIPKDYRNFHNLQQGDEIVIFYNSLILMIPKREMQHIREDHEKLALINKLLR